MKPTRSTSRIRKEQMIESLRTKIIQGRYEQGSFIPSELELCEKYQLSKSTVRKALETLVSEGLIEKVPRIGSRVKSSANTERVTVRFGYYTSMVKETNMLSIVDRFNEANPGINVQPIPVPHPMKQDLFDAFLADNAFDVMTFNLLDFDSLNESVNVNDKLEPFDINPDIYPFLNHLFKNDGVQYVMPFVFTPVILCYNKAHFREKNTPEPDSGWTWQDLFDASNKLSEGTDRLGFYVHYMSENRWPLLLLQNGISFQRNKHGRYSFTDPKVKQAMQTYKAIATEQLSFPNYLSEGETDVETLFLNGKVSIIMATYSTLNAFKEAPFEYDIAPLPHLNELRTLLIVMGMAINKNSENKYAAKKFTDYLLSYETQLYMRKHTLSIPSVKQAAEWEGEELLARPRRYNLYREIAHTFRTFSDLNLTAQQLFQIRDELRFYWSNISTLDEVLLRLEKNL